ncbi:MAG: AbrB/MazE/SpoVT family DNA-binding domain-containing protein [Gaiellaceae bacterium]
MAKRVKQGRRRGFTRLSSKRQVTIPVHALEDTGLGPGDELKVEVDVAGRIVLTRASDVVDRSRAIADTAGSLSGVYEPGELERLRSEWR